MITPTTGYYSLIQYCPDRSRLESANLGVVLLCPSLGFLESRMANANDRVRRFFGDEAGNMKQLHAIKRLLDHRLESEREGLLELSAFEKFRGTLSNELQISPPRAVRVENPIAELAQLYDELVGTRVRHEPQRHSAVLERLEEIFQEPRFGALVRRNVSVHVPVLGSDITVPFAFQNGRLNLIEIHQFDQKREADVLQDAFKTAVQGNLIYKHADSQYGACRLVVIGSFRNSTVEAKQRIGSVLRDHNVKMFEEQQTDDLAREILETGHA